MALRSLARGTDDRATNEKCQVRSMAIKLVQDRRRARAQLTSNRSSSTVCESLGVRGFGRSIIQTEGGTRD
jgi:hypothetical protein